MALTPEEKSQLARQVREKTLVEPVLTPEYRRSLDLVDIEDTGIETREGRTHIYIIRAHGRPANCSVYINFHGGGFVRGHGPRNLAFCARMAASIAGIVVDVDYRLAPEYPYPAAVNEAYDTVRWVFANAGALGIDPDLVTVGGDSAGGNLTLATALRAGQTGDFQIRHILIYYPAVDMATPAREKPEWELNIIAPERMNAFNRCYLDDDAEAARSPYVSMLYAPDDMLARLPDTLLITAGKDNLRFEAEALAARMVAAGVTVTMRRFLESRHSFIINCIDEWEAAQALIIETLQNATRQN